MSAFITEWGYVVRRNSHCLLQLSFRYIAENQNDYLLDINECSEAECPLNSECVNTIGSFECKCNNGYSMNEDNECVGKYKSTEKL